MEALKIEETARTPLIDFDSKSGNMMIRGRMIPDIEDKFWKPVLKWIYAYASRPSLATKISIDIEYMNNWSVKNILFLLDRLNTLYVEGHHVVVEWIYGDDDLEMKETGLDFSSIVDLPFEFVEVSRNPHYIG